MDKRKEVKRYLLNDLQLAIEIARNCTSYNGSFEDWVDTWDLEELCNCMDAYEVARAIIYGDVHDVGHDVRYDAYGNLETVWDDTLENDAKMNIDDIVEELFNLYPAHINIDDDELKKILDADDTMLIYRISTEDQTKYWYDFDEIVNGFIKLGMDCSVDYAEVDGDFCIEDENDETLEELDWIYEGDYHA